MRNIAMGTTTNRSAAVAAVFSVLSLVPIVPHLVEDAAVGVFFERWVELDAGMWAVGGVLAVQMVFALASLRERRWGYGGVFFLATVWVVTVLAEHWGAFLPGDFRTGLSSRLAVWGIVVFQLIAAVSGLVAFRGTRRTSFSGTGNFGT